jgi:hypothetical protein
MELLFILKPIKYSFFLSLLFCLPRSLPQLHAKNNGADLTSKRKTNKSTPLQPILRYFASISPNFFIYLMIRVIGNEKKNGGSKRDWWWKQDNGGGSKSSRVKDYVIRGEAKNLF